MVLNVHRTIRLIRDGKMRGKGVWRMWETTQSAKSEWVWPSGKELGW